MRRVLEMDSVSSCETRLAVHPSRIYCRRAFHCFKGSQAGHCCWLRQHVPRIPQASRPQGLSMAVLADVVPGNNNVGYTYVFLKTEFCAACVTTSVF